MVIVPRLINLLILSLVLMLSGCAAPGGAYPLWQRLDQEASAQPDGAWFVSHDRPESLCFPFRCH